MIVHARFSAVSDRISIDVDGHPLTPRGEMASYAEENVLLWANRFFELLDEEVRDRYSLHVFGLKFHYLLLQSQIPASGCCGGIEYHEAPAGFPAAQVIAELKRMSRANRLDVPEKENKIVCECASPQEKAPLFPGFILTNQNDSAAVRVCLSEDEAKACRNKLCITEAAALRIENHGFRTRLYVPPEDVADMMDYVNLYFHQIPYINSMICALEKAPLRARDKLCLAALKENRCAFYADDLPDRMEIGQTLPFAYCAVPSFAGNAGLRLAADPAKLKETEEGLTALQPGNTTVRVLDQDDNVLYQKEIAILQHQYVTAIHIVAANSRTRFHPGETAPLQIIPYPANAEDANDLTVTTSNPDVAIVSPNGYLVAFKPGKCVLTAAGKKTKGKLTVYVVEKAQRINLFTSRSPIMSDEACEIVASPEPAGACVDQVRWSVSPPQFGELRIADDGVRCTLVPNIRLQTASNIYVTCEIEGVSAQTCVQVRPLDRREGLRVTCVLATICAFLFCWTALLNLGLWVGLITCHVGKQNNRTGDTTYKSCFTANIVALVLTGIFTILYIIGFLF